MGRTPPMSVERLMTDALMGNVYHAFRQLSPLAFWQLVSLVVFLPFWVRTSLVAFGTALVSSTIAEWRKRTVCLMNC